MAYYIGCAFCGIQGKQCKTGSVLCSVKFLSCLCAGTWILPALSLLYQNRGILCYLYCNRLSKKFGLLSWSAMALRSLWSSLWWTQDVCIPYNSQPESTG